MFLDVKELGVRKLRIHKFYPPGTIDYHTEEFKQVDPLEVRATAELVDGMIRVSGELHTRVEMVCARCLDPVTEEIGREFDLYYRPLASLEHEEALRLAEDDTEVGFFQGEGLFLADALAEEVNLTIPLKAICRSDCRGLCAHCGANLNLEECHCQSHNADPRLAQLARVKQAWFKKQ
jgi:uncharacterized protein